MAAAVKTSLWGVINLHFLFTYFTTYLPGEHMDTYMLNCRSVVKRHWGSYVEAKDSASSRLSTELPRSERAGWGPGT